tara:strand:- start:855 stop:1280 length:426 start_codon:yes stop_codon:yes gene_type:complete
MANDNKHRGHIAEYFTAYQISKEGYTPFLIPHSQAFDIFCSHPTTGHMIRVQVKSTNRLSEARKKVVVPHSYYWNMQIGATRVDKYKFNEMEIFSFVNIEEELIAFMTAKEASRTPSKVTLKAHEMETYTFQRAINMLGCE